MSEHRGPGFQSGDELRRAFDRSFAEPPRGEVDATEDLLTITIGGDAYAIRVAEIAGLHIDQRVTRVPTHVPELLGITGYRASIVPVYDLGALMGYPAVGVPRWLVTLAGDTHVALAIGQFNGHLQLSGKAFAESERRTQPFTTTVAQTTDGALPVLHLPSVLVAIHERARVMTEQKE